MCFTLQTFRFCKRMVSYIYVDRSGHKVARPVKNREEYFALRNAEPNVKNFAAARQGDKEAKKQLVQFNYNDLLPDGVLKGCCHPCMTYAHDIDCGCRADGGCMPSAAANWARRFLRTKCACRCLLRRKWTPRPTIWRG